MQSQAIYLYRKKTLHSFKIFFSVFAIKPFSINQKASSALSQYSIGYNSTKWPHFRVLVSTRHMRPATMETLVPSPRVTPFRQIVTQCEPHSRDAGHFESIRTAWPMSWTVSWRRCWTLLPGQGTGQTSPGREQLCALFENKGRAKLIWI